MIKHRIEIQNLRGISILAVLCFHLWPENFPNGFLGVDVFFVISGYLITEQLLRNVNSEFKDYLFQFYFQRIKRILPSAISILAIFLVACNFLLGAFTLVQNLPEARWANLFAANWYFLNNELDYFASGNLSLFAHYWSLAIEEQFYLLWPIFIFLNKKKHLIPISIGLISLTMYFSSEYPAYFYGTFQRIWELVIGSLVALTPKMSKIELNAKILWPFLLLLLLPITIIPEKIATFYTVLLAALLIYSLGSAIIKGPLYFLGQISFSLYLVHYPVIKIYDAYFEKSNFIVRTMVILVSIAIITLLNYLVIEKPFRYRDYVSRKNLFIGSCFAILIFQTLLVVAKGRYV